jgi:Peptidase A4 family
MRKEIVLGHREGTVVKRKAVVKSGTKRLRLFPPIPKGFEAEKATNKDLRRYGIPLRPDPSREPGLTALWDQHVRRYRDFEHLQATTTSADPAIEPRVSALALFPREACGYELTSFNAPFTVFSGRWTIPNLHHGPTPPGLVFFRTFFGLGFLDAHVEMTVDSAQKVTALIRIHTGAQLNLTVRPGDTINATLCLQTNTAGTASYFLANETTAQTVNLSIDTGFPPAVTIDAGISRGVAGNPNNPLAGFGTVYFDELSAYTTNGTRRLVDGVATAMVESGTTLARPFRLNDFAFKIVRN